MKKNIIMSIVFVMFSFSAFANNFKIPKEGEKFEDFYSGYDLEQAEVGDLNKDGLDDAVLLIGELSSNLEKEKPKKILILFKKKDGGYRLVTKNERWLVNGGWYSYEPSVAIKKGVLHVSEGILAGAHVSKKYVFRFQKGHMELIGYEEYSMDRVSHDSEKVSINLSTNKMSITKEKENGDEKTDWKKTDIRSSYFLENMTDETVYKLLKEVKYYD